LARRAELQGAELKFLFAEPEPDVEHGARGGGRGLSSPEGVHKLYVLTENITLSIEDLF